MTVKFGSKGADLAPGQADLAPGRADLAPGRADLAPERADLAPERADLAPGRADLAPGRADLAPRRADLEPWLDYQARDLGPGPGPGSAPLPPALACDSRGERGERRGEDRAVTSATHRNILTLCHYQPIQIFTAEACLQGHVMVS